MTTYNIDRAASKSLELLDRSSTTHSSYHQAIVQSLRDLTIGVNPAVELRPENDSVTLTQEERDVLTVFRTFLWADHEFEGSKWVPEDEDTGFGGGWMAITSEYTRHPEFVAEHGLRVVA